MHKTYSGIIILLLLIIIGGIYKFIFQGSVSPKPDGRSSVQLNVNERDLILTEMRAFLSSVQKITQGIAENDMRVVSEYALQVGKASQAKVPGTLIGKMPLTFKRLGFDTHSKFEQLAIDANDLGDGSYTLKQLSDLMQNCVTCHESYRIDIEKE